MLSHHAGLGLLCAAAAFLIAGQGRCAPDNTWDLRADTWVATDALGRSLPGYDECGPPREGRYVGIFYFLWLGQHGTRGPYDITRITAGNPAEPKWGTEQAFHHWGESELGYYLSDDDYVIRKHAYMLMNAGVDVIFFDVTNAFTYDAVYLKLCSIYHHLRGEGLKTPQVAFLAHSGQENVVAHLYKNFYKVGLYPDLWFKWQGRPLILAKPDGMADELKSFFTFRESWAWSDPNGWFADGRDKWPWLDHHPQKPGWRVEGKPEQISVSVAQHPMTNIGRSFHAGKQPDPANFKTDEGLCFAEQWKRALEVDPEFVFITGWNEWVAQRFIAEGKHEMLMGRKLSKGDSFFVDAYNQEFSRDIEPMKGGHTDNYYYQMIDGIRRFKGVRAPEPVSAPKTITIDGKFDDWESVGPEFRDYSGDTEHRESKGWGEAGTYINKTGRNDFVRLKVARDAKNVYFYAECREKITPHTDPRWMLLFIDADRSPKTAWQGYDYLVNWIVADAKTTLVMKNLGGWKWDDGVRVPSRVVGNKMEIAIPRKVLGLPDGDFTLDFHWADNIQKPDDIIEFAVSGDSAPDRRFNYRYSTKHANAKARR
jgi:hypothetical protein